MQSKAQRSTPLRKNGSRRRLLIPLAGLLVLAIIATGTLAYTNFIQEAKNEFEGVITNHGVRLHDDYQKVPGATSAVKDIYVENYGESPLLVRIRLEELYTLGTTVVIGGPGADPVVDAGHPELGKWAIFTGPINSSGPNLGKSQFHGGDWTWTVGGTKWYLPTENLADTGANAVKSDNIYGRQGYNNNGIAGTPDSAGARPGTYSTARPFTDADEGVVFTNNHFPTYTVATPPVAGAPYTAKTVAETPDATVVTMAYWLSPTGLNKAPGDFWVVDADGWCYWAQMLNPGEATGLLLAGVTLENSLTDAYYYGINANLEAVTWNDRNLYVGNGITDDAKSLLSIISGNYAYDLTGTSADVNQLIEDEAGTLWRVLAVDEAQKRALILRERVISDPTTGVGIAVRLHSADNAQWGAAAPAELRVALNGTGAANAVSAVTGSQAVANHLLCGNVAVAASYSYFDTLPAALKARAINSEGFTFTFQAANDTVTTGTAPAPATAGPYTVKQYLFLLSEFDISGRNFTTWDATGLIKQGDGRPAEASAPGIAGNIFPTAATRIAYDDAGIARAWWVRSIPNGAANNLMVPADGGPYTWGEQGVYVGNPGLGYTPYVTSATVVPLTNFYKWLVPAGYLFRDNVVNATTLLYTNNLSNPAGFAQGNIGLVANTNRINGTTGGTNILRGSTGVAPTAGSGVTGPIDASAGVYARPAMWIDLTK